jgi:hypothetical protein
MFYVLDEKLIGGKGYTIRDHRGTEQYRANTRKEAERVCGRFNRADAAPPVCNDCDTYPADVPSPLCVGCDAYRAHTS